MDQLRLAPYRHTIRRKLFRLKMRFRLLLFMESALLGLTAVFLAAIVVVAAGKVVYLPEVLRSLSTLVASAELVGFVSILYAFARPVDDLELASFIDREIRQSGRIESAVDFLERSDEIDSLYLNPFMESTAGILSSTPDSQIISLQMPPLWRYAAIALALLIAVQLFVPVARLVHEDQDPFLIRDLHRLSMELEGALLNAAKREGVSEEDKELFERAEELSRRMDATTIDPSYLQDELLRLTRGINERSQRMRSANDQLLAQLLDEIERLRKDQESQGVQNAALKRALDELAYRASEIQESTMQQRKRATQELNEALQELLRTSESQLSPEDMEMMQQIISELQSQLQQDSDLRRISGVAEESLKSLRKDSLQDLMYRDRDQLSEQARQFLRSQRDAQQGAGSYGFEGQGRTGFQTGGSEGEGYVQGVPGGPGDGTEGAIDRLGVLAGDTDDGEAGLRSAPAEGIGTGAGGDLYGDPSGQVEGYTTYVDHRLSGEGDEMDLTLSTVLGSPTGGEVQMDAPDRLETSFGEAYEGQIPEGEYPERYKQIISNYFDGLK